MAAILQHRRDTKANWTAVNPVLYSGQLGFETDTGAFKLGNGVTAWSSLPYGPGETRTSAEIAAAVTPTNYHYPPGDVRRYGTNTTPGTTDMSVAIQAAINQNLSGGAPAVLHRETYAFGTTLTYSSGLSLLGEGRQHTILSYTGAAQAFVSTTPSTRTYNVLMRDFNITDAATGTIGLDLSSVSLSAFENLVVTGFTTGIKITSPTSGYSVYNRFYNVTAANATTGFHLLATSSNANTFYACRANVCTTGAIIANSNENHFDSCQFEGCTNGVSLTATGAGFTPRNFINQCRFESNTNNIVVGANVSETALIMNYHVDGVVLTDAGTRTQVLGLHAANDVMKLDSAMGGATGVPYTLQRSANGGTNGAMLRLVDAVTSSGTPTTLQIEVGRSTGHAVRVLNGVAGTEAFGVLASGAIRTNQNSGTATVGAQVDRFPIYDETGVLIGYIPIYAT